MSPCESIDDQAEYYSEVFKNLDASVLTITSVVFEGCAFHGCDFSETAFRRCRFIECVFIGCNLSVASFGYSKLSDVNFRDSKLIGVDWAAVSWSTLLSSAPVRFHQSILDQGSFHGLVLKELTMEFCRARQVDFAGGDFRNSCFVGTDFAGAVFSNTDLSGSDFSEATGFSIDVTQNRVEKARFSRFEALSLLESLGVELVD